LRKPNDLYFGAKAQKACFTRKAPILPLFHISPYFIGQKYFANKLAFKAAML